MSASTLSPPMGEAGAGRLSRERTVAGPGFNRWIVPPAALAIHLCIGMAYGFSVFWLPLSRAIGIDKSVACPGMSLADALVTTTCDWRISDLGWMYTLFFVTLGSAAAIWGGWLERAGPRKAGVAAAICWCGGLAVSALGVHIHQLWLMWLGSGVIGGIGLGLGYISPVSTLIKWFPDRRGMATGMAIMGFGGGALVGAPLAALLIGQFRTPTDAGVWQTFLVMAAIYGVFMLSGAFGYRVPPEGWTPPSWVGIAKQSKLITSRYVELRDAHRTPQFWLIWAVLTLNVSAGIGVIGIASPMLQEVFAGKLVGAPDVGFKALSADQSKAIGLIAAGFVGLISLFNIVGRFFWASLSDRLSRKTTYATFFLLGIAMYALAPTFARIGSMPLFVGAVCIIISMYGGGFATVPAYLADVFGTKYVGAIHGRLLTAWSFAGIVGPVLVNYIREFEINAGVPRDHVYDATLYVLSGLLVAGFVCNLLIRPVAARWYAPEPAVVDGTAQASQAGSQSLDRSFGIGRGGFSPVAGLAWAAVGVPLLWGAWRTLTTVVALAH